jgi:hypothetical protein
MLGGARLPKALGGWRGGRSTGEGVLDSETARGCGAAVDIGGGRK